MSIVPISYDGEYGLPDDTDPYSGGVLVEVDDDDFLNMAIYINETYGFAKLGKYYGDIRDLNDKLIDTFLNLYDYIDNQDKENIDKIIEKFNDIKEKFIHHIIDIDKMLLNNEIFIKILDYFHEINLVDLDHRKNGECIISSLHMEWLKRVDKIGSFYQSISEEINDKIVKSKSRGLMGYFRKALNYSTSEKSIIQSHKQIFYKETSNVLKKTSLDKGNDINLLLDEPMPIKTKSSIFNKLKIPFACLIFSIRLYFSEIGYRLSHFCGMINNNFPTVNMYPQVVEIYNNQTYEYTYLC